MGVTTDHLIDVMRNAATSAGVKFVSVRERFNTHEACAGAAYPEWINAVVATSSSGSGTNTPGAGSFHPNPTGYVNMKNVIIGNL